MTTFNVEEAALLCRTVQVSKDHLTVELADGRRISVPVAWYPRLQHGTPRERANWRLIGGGEGIHWPELDEDISVAGLVAGRASGECPASLQRWRDRRKRASTMVAQPNAKRRAARQ